MKNKKGVKINDTKVQEPIDNLVGFFNILLIIDKQNNLAKNKDNAIIK